MIHTSIIQLLQYCLQSVNFPVDVTVVGVDMIDSHALLALETCMNH